MNEKLHFEHKKQNVLYRGTTIENNSFDQVKSAPTDVKSGNLTVEKNSFFCLLWNLFKWITATLKNENKSEEKEIIFG